MSKDLEDIQRMKSLLDASYQWPADYMFKFIIPPGKLEELKKIFPVSDVILRESKTGKYISVTVSLRMESSDEVLAVYYQARRIQGLIAL